MRFELSALEVMGQPDDPAPAVFPRTVDDARKELSTSPALHAYRAYVRRRQTGWTEELRLLTSVMSKALVKKAERVSLTPSYFSIGANRPRVNLKTLGDQTLSEETLRVIEELSAYIVDLNGVRVVTAGDNVRETFDAWLRSGDATAFVTLPTVSGHAEVMNILRSLDWGGETSARYDDGMPELETRTDSVVKRRREIASEWLTADAVSKQLGSTAGNGAQRAMEERKAGRILGVWHGPDRGYRYAPWQFSTDGQPLPAMAELLTLLREHGGISGDGNKTNEGWAEATWFLAPNAILEELLGLDEVGDGPTPAAYLRAQPGKVLKAAREEFMEEPSARGG